MSNIKDVRSLHRRDVIKTGLALGAAAATGTFAAPAIASGRREWKMVMTWQTVLPGLGTGAVRLAKRITALSEGQLTIKPYGGGELVPPLGVFDAVSNGTAEMGHAAPYYWLSKNRSCAFFCTVPGGLTAQEQNAWLYFGGGLKLWHELYADFGLIAFPAGNTGTQMGGWFKKELHSKADIQGLKMRIPGLGGEVFGKLGGNPQVIPPQELFTALQSGVIDATEWVGPWNDIALGFHRVAPYYYGPGFHEAGPTLELMINKKAFEALPRHLQQVVKIACATENMLMESEYYYNNVTTMRELRDTHGVKVREFPEDLLKAFYEISEDVVSDTATLGDINRRIYESYRAFRRNVIHSGHVLERGLLSSRDASVL